LNFHHQLTFAHETLNNEEEEKFPFYAHKKFAADVILFHGKMNEEKSLLI
jgi:hypothetical protein